MSSQLTERPSWWDTVKEIDIDEARVLLALGQEVWHDCTYCAEGVVFDDIPFKRRTLDYYVSHDTLVADWRKSRDVLVFYVRKGESVDNNEEKGL